MRELVLSSQETVEENVKLMKLDCDQLMLKAEKLESIV